MSEATQRTDDWEPKILAFLCNWCSYAGADLAGTSRMQYPPNVRVIRVPCSGRVNPIFIVAALRQGADGVLVSGCHPGTATISRGTILRGGDSRCCSAISSTSVLSKGGCSSRGCRPLRGRALPRW